MIRPNAIEGNVDIMIMREGVQPIWEDAANSHGGKWSVKLRKGLATHLWEDLVLALIGEEADGAAADVCGAVLSVRFHDDSIALWNRSADDDASLAKLRCVRRRENVVDTQVCRRSCTPPNAIPRAPTHPTPSQ